MRVNAGMTQVILVFFAVLGIHVYDTFIAVNRAQEPLDVRAAAMSVACALVLPLFLVVVLILCIHYDVG